jgi:hypothetical protein
MISSLHIGCLAALRSANERAGSSIPPATLVAIARALDPVELFPARIGAHRYTNYSSMSTGSDLPGTLTILREIAVEIWLIHGTRITEWKTNN